MIPAGEIHLAEEVGMLLTYSFEDFVYAGQGPAAVFDQLVKLSKVDTESSLAIRL